MINKDGVDHGKPLALYFIHVPHGLVDSCVLSRSFRAFGCTAYLSSLKTPVFYTCSRTTY
jgi:hypothetical protein